MALRTLLPSDWDSKDVLRTFSAVSLFLKRSKGVNRLFEDLPVKDLNEFVR
jgi:hypothetical protein